MPLEPWSPKDVSGPKSKNDTDGKPQEAIVDKTEDAVRDLVHGDGGTEGLSTGANELGQDDRGERERAGGWNEGAPNCFSLYATRTFKSGCKTSNRFPSSQGSQGCASSAGERCPPPGPACA